MCKNLDISEISVIWQFVMTGQIKLSKDNPGANIK
jgi:hypothetical protein